MAGKTPRANAGRAIGYGSSEVTWFVEGARTSALMVSGESYTRTDAARSKLRASLFPPSLRVFGLVGGRFGKNIFVCHHVVG